MTDGIDDLRSRGTTEEIVVGQTPISPSRARLFVARGDPTDVAVYSGIPYYFLLAALRGGIIDAPVPLHKDGIAYAVRRIAWNASRPLTGNRHGGYRYTMGRHNHQWAPARAKLRGTCILSAWNLLPRWVVDDSSIERWYMVDLTLKQLFEEYGEQEVTGRRIVRKAIEEEREGYEAAQGVIVHSRWAAKSVIEEYGVSPANVHIVPVAANIDADSYAIWEAAELDRRLREPAPRRDSSLRFVFVGLDVKRKGLERFLRGLDIARRSGSRATLRVIGATAKQVLPELRSTPGVEWCGPVDKHGDPQRFLRLVGECDVGFLLSRAESAGCVTFEYQALGLPVLCTSAGGAPDQILPGSGRLVDVAATAEEIAGIILELEREPELVEKMSEAAWQQRHAAMWDARVEEIGRFWPHRNGPE